MREWNAACLVASLLPLSLYFECVPAAWQPFLRRSCHAPRHALDFHGFRETTRSQRTTRHADRPWNMPAGVVEARKTTKRTRGSVLPAFLRKTLSKERVGKLWDSAFIMGQSRAYTNLYIN